MKNILKGAIENEAKERTRWISEYVISYIRCCLLGNFVSRKGQGVGGGDGVIQFGEGKITGEQNF